jgi:hypothetical protein
VKRKFSMSENVSGPQEEVASVLDQFREPRQQAVRGRLILGRVRPRLA